MKAIHKTYCDFARNVDRKLLKNNKLYVIMFKYNDGEYSFEAMSHCRKTKLGIFSIANSSWQAETGREMKVLEIDLNKAKVLFEGSKPKTEVFK